jgi:hypothetical protein
MERSRADQEIADLTRNGHAQAGLSHVGQGLTNSSPPAQHRTYDPAVSANTIRAEAEARYGLTEPIDVAADAVERGLARIDRLNAILSIGYVDPAMVALKEEYQRGLLYRLKRYMRPGSGVTEESLTIEATHRTQRR